MFALTLGKRKPRSTVEWKFRAGGRWLLHRQKIRHDRRKPNRATSVVRSIRSSGAPPDRIGEAHRQIDDATTSHRYISQGSSHSWHRIIRLLRRTTARSQRIAMQKSVSATILVDAGSKCPMLSMFLRGLPKVVAWRHRS